MGRVPTEISAVGRARWLAELSDALVEAQRVAWLIGVSGRGNAEAMALYGRIEATLAEIQALRLSRLTVARDPSSRNWADALPWARAAERPSP